ncbi:glycosyltransferase family 4 protein [Microbulbifer sp. TYP-18]|uniref:glycosyltransferase family 4 protein n=1 Tax=Microbulbifer sp. TYP-18 TaxID=3230024 RepID=UPI0034C5EC3C
MDINTEELTQTLSGGGEEKTSLAISNSLSTQVASMTEKLKELEADYVYATERVTELECMKSKLEKELESVRAEHKQQLEDFRQAYARELERVKASARGERSNPKLSAIWEELTRVERQVSNFEQSASYRLGDLFVKHRHSLRGLVSLPYKIWCLQREVRRERSLDEPVKHSALQKYSVFKLQIIYARSGCEAAEEYVTKVCNRPEEFAKALVELAKLELKVNLTRAKAIGCRAVDADPGVARRASFASFLYEAGSIAEAYKALSALPFSERASLKYQASQIEGAFKLKNATDLIPERAPTSAYDPVARRILYVAASVLPYHVSGYTTRTQNVLSAIIRKGWEVKCIARPGYPLDRPDAREVEVGNEYELDGVKYRLLGGKERNKVDSEQYLLLAAKQIAEEIRAFKPMVVHAASNYETALPALIAARQLGIPFYYEVRGLWEYTAASKRAGWETTERFALDRKLESLAAQHAEGVFTLTNAMADELVARGVTHECVQLLPNAIDLQKFQSRPYNKLLASKLGIKRDDYVIGYIGSLVGYEGLDDLLVAVSMFKETMSEVQLVIVGAGAIMNDLQWQVQQLGIDKNVHFVGRVAPDSVQEYFSILDVVALPRKDIPVCRLVSPLKPLEAMAMRVPMVVSSVNALSEMVKHEQTALIHQSEDPADLCRCLKRLADDSLLRKNLAENAFQHVHDNRTWSQVIGVVVEAYERYQKV